MFRILTATSLLALAMPAAHAEANCVLVSPGDLRVRHDIQLLDDAGLIQLPTTGWPLMAGDLNRALAGLDDATLTLAQEAARDRLRSDTDCSTEAPGATAGFSVGAARHPRIIRSFGSTMRGDAVATTGISWHGKRVFGRVAVQAVANAMGDESVLLDGTVIGVNVGNWILTAGWQDRWWGPGHDGSLILSNNARPLPALALQRNLSTAFRSAWLKWLGPWNIAAFAAYMDDDREVDDALLIGVRAAFVPLPGLEIGVSRTAQWCGQGRPCNGGAFLDLLLGNDNRGVNVDPSDEPGNQLGGVDLRWSLPGSVPATFYLQWVAEDTRRGGPELGSWLRLAGLEYATETGTNSLRMHLEVAETSCRAGGAGFSELLPNCAYEHGIYQSGYRYKGRSIGHGMDGDGLSYSGGATLVQSRGQMWSASLRRIKVNRAGAPSGRHTLSATPGTLTDAEISYSRSLRYGTIQAGIGLLRSDIRDTTSANNELTGFLQWYSY